MADAIMYNADDFPNRAVNVDVLRHEIRAAGLPVRSLWIDTLNQQAGVDCGQISLPQRSILDDVILAHMGAPITLGVPIVSRQVIGPQQSFGPAQQVAAGTTTACTELAIFQGETVHGSAHGLYQTSASGVSVDLLCGGTSMTDAPLTLEPTGGEWRRFTVCSSDSKPILELEPCTLELQTAGQISLKYVILSCGYKTEYAAYTFGGN